ncbi:hypothetical protein [Arthrobacter sp. H5]|uniref:hypothetical protein n=1 Tax=Arthrobacter sp. H5 TaxID=1267973 RepID=UPI0004B3B306|nr:hypothetical protein [Arthrobacter sp. H5]
MTDKPEEQDKQDKHDKHENTGPEGTIPEAKDGVGGTTTDEPSNFEPEEDKDSRDDPS